MDPEKDAHRTGGYLTPEPDYGSYDFPLPSKTESAAHDGAAAALGNDLIPSVSNAVASAGADVYGKDPRRRQQGHGGKEGDDYLGRTDTAAAEDEAYPEGGLRAWSVVLGSWLALFSALGIMNSLAIFQTYVAMHQLEGYSEGTIGWIFSVYNFLCFFGGIYIGPVFDQYGPRWLVLSGTVCLVLGVMLLSICT
ncbi:hypothetical protein LX36DRAFT_529676, partial [Colletotrichum falcatum]